MKYGNSRKQAVVLFFAFLCLMVFPEFSGAEEGFKPRFSLKLTGGLDYFKWGDVNKSLKSLSDALDPYITRGKINEMNHYKPAWEAEVRMDIAPKLSLGFSASSPIRLENNDHVEYSLHSSQEDIPGWVQNDLKIKLSMPFKLGLNYSLFSNSKINVFLNGGMNYYRMTISERREYKALPIYILLSETSVHDLKAHSDGNVGFYGGIGFEYNISNRLAIVFEGQVRHIKISDLKGSEGGLEGTLYLFENEWSEIVPGSKHSDLRIFKNEPGISYDKAVIDLSGFSLSAGLRIKLF